MPTGPRYPGAQPVASRISASVAQRQPVSPGTLPTFTSFSMWSPRISSMCTLSPATIMIDFAVRASGSSSSSATSSQVVMARRGHALSRLVAVVPAVRGRDRLGLLDVGRVLRLRAPGDRVLAGVGEHLELVRGEAADRAGVGLDRAEPEPEAREDPRVGVVHRLVALHQRVAIDVERVGVLHQELAPAHHAEPRPDLVAELDLDLVEVHRQLPVAADVLAHDVGDHFLVRRAEQEVALVAVVDLEELRAELVPAARLLPQLRGHHVRHVDLHRPRTVHFLADDRLDLAQRDEAERHPRIDAGRDLLDHARAEHELLARDFRLGGGFLQRGEIEPRNVHRYRGVEWQTVDFTP